MEKTGTLINRLQEQYKDNSAPEKLLVTIHMLLAELNQAPQPGNNGTHKNVAVIMPVNPSHFQQYTESFVGNIGEDEEQQSNADAVMPEMKMEVNTQVENKKTEKEAKPVSEEPKIIEELKLTEEESESFTDDFPDFDPIRDIPTLAHQRAEKFEINDYIGIKDKSLNDKHKTTKKEIGANLHDSPVRDLRKAIGINDRFLFINELFRGDEVMYERSIKTINSFTILPEAEYWIIRELKTKLGWVEKSDTVKLFDQLVKRRFS